MPNNDTNPQHGLLHAARRSMVEQQLVRRGISDTLVLEAFETVPRHEFVPPDKQSQAYDDRPLSIGQGQTISQPYVVALMLQLAQLHRGAQVLDVGCGSGYQSALLAAMGCNVYALEVIPQLAQAARERLVRAGYPQVSVDCRDGRFGWPQHAPYDAILAAAAPQRVPEALVEQLRPGGRLILPVGDWRQELLVVSKTPEGRTIVEHQGGVAFVPMVSGEQE